MNDGSISRLWQMLSKSSARSVVVDASHASASAKSRFPRPLTAVAYFWKSPTAASSTASSNRLSG